MQIKTLLGASIQEALADARALLGDDVVLLESIPAQDGQPARITVMVDEAAAPEPAAAAPLAFGYGAARAARLSAAAASSGPAAPGGPAAIVSPGAAAPPPTWAATAGGDDPLEAAFAAPPPAPEAARAPAPAPTRAPLFPPPSTAPPAPPAPTPTPTYAPAAPAFDAGALAEQIEARLAARFDALTGRLATLEATLATSAAGAAGAWAAHPVHAAVLRSGLSPATTVALFGAAAERGLTPEAEAEPLRWALAAALRDRLAPTAPPRHPAQALAVVGAAGAGKTSLLLKLAADPRYGARRRPAVLVVTPKGEGLAQDPAPLYEQHGLTVFPVTTPKDVRDAVEKTTEFDVLLIDTPALPADRAAARRALKRLQGLFAGIAPLEVVLVLDATRAAAPLAGADLAGLPLLPTAVALTHLDEVAGWGRAAEWLLDLGLPVPFAVTGPERTGALAPYSPAWLAESLVSQWAAA